MSDSICINNNEVHSRNKKSLPTVDGVRAYLLEIGRIPLLKSEQEVFYAKLVQQMIFVLGIQKKLICELKRKPTLAEWAKKVKLSEQELLNVLHQGKQAKHKMIVANLRLVVSVAKKYQKRNLEFLDLIQEGTLGLERGVDKFDPTKGYKFSTYAYWWIRQAIIRAIALQGRTIKLPIHITEKLNQIRRIQRELSQKLGYIPSVTEIAKALGLQPSEIRQYLLYARQPISLEVRVGSEQDTELQDMLEDKGLSPDRYIVQQCLKEDIINLLLKLSPQQQEVLTLHFGLAGEDELSLTQISQRMGISREKVRYLEHQAFNVLRWHKDKLNSYLAS